MLNCDFRSSKGYMAQLMRAYVVMPDCPVEVQLNPRVQPGPAPCPIFYACSDGPLTLLGGGIWVLRFPYPYSMIDYYWQKGSGLF